MVSVQPPRLGQAAPAHLLRVTALRAHHWACPLEARGQDQLFIKQKTDNNPAIYELDKKSR